MFNPIKNFISFIQKNTSNNVAFENVSNEKINIMDNSSIEKSTNQTSFDEIDVDIQEGCVVSATNNPTMNCDEDDIELQIKSSIMIKKSASQSNRPVIPTLSVPCTPDLSSLSSKMQKPDFNQNLRRKTLHISPEDDDELGDFKNDPTQICTDDFCSVGSELEAEDVQTEDEEVFEDRPYAEIEDTGKVFVDVNEDLISSIASSIAEDPLAIDVTTMPTNMSAIDSHENTGNGRKEEILTSEEIIWFDIDNEKIVKNSPQNLIVNKESEPDAKHDQPPKPTNNERRTEEPNEEMERSDNSDSGLGIESSTSLLHTTLENSITESPNYSEGNQNITIETTKPTSTKCEIDGKKAKTTSAVRKTSFDINKASKSKVTVGGNATVAAITASETRPSTPEVRKPMRSNLKRRLCENDSINIPSTSNSTTIQEVCVAKKPKRSINFDAVQVFYFPRQQGFGCVPSAGGCTLGMGSQHIDTRRLTLAEHAAELRRAHRLQLQEINPRGSSSDDSDESEEDYLSEGSGSDLDADSNGFLQPVTPKQRRAILKAAGIRKIDTSEKVECRNIRNSREVCGCTCRDFCDPETCTCSQAGIKCQVDRAMFPCGCSRDACGNTTGRVEFNPARVRTHFIHTIMRLDMENRQQQPAAPLGVVNCAYESTTALMSQHNITNPNSSNTHLGYYNLQSQSNYSSGYASPAYSSDPSSSYYQQQTLIYPNHSDGVANGVPQYQNLDNTDGNAFNATPATYVGEVLPNYDVTSTSDKSTLSSTYHHSVGYTNSSFTSYQTHQEQLIQHTTAVYPMPTSQNSNGNENNVILTTGTSVYSSCAIPSRPPYGAATTCSSSTQSNTTAIENDFISLNTPIASSSRLSQINDLLQHNRNTTAALVAVTSHSAPSTPNTAISNIGISSISNSIETPPITISDSSKGCFLFSQSETDLALSSQNVANQVPKPQSEPPPTIIIHTPVIEFKDDGDYCI